MIRLWNALVIGLLLTLALSVFIGIVFAVGWFFLVYLGLSPLVGLALSGVVLAFAIFTLLAYLDPGNR